MLCTNLYYCLIQQQPLEVAQALSPVVIFRNCSINMRSSLITFSQQILAVNSGAGHVYVVGLSEHADEYQHAWFSGYLSTNNIHAGQNKILPFCFIFVCYDFNQELYTKYKYIFSRSKILCRYDLNFDFDTQEASLLSSQSNHSK